MRSSRPMARSAFTVGVLMALVLACGGIRQDELSCEDAVGHLQQCCPGFTGSNLHCLYDPGCGGVPIGLGDTGGGGGATLPDLDVDQSSCIRSESCSQLRSSGVCARAAAFDTASDAATQAVCP